MDFDQGTPIWRQLLDSFQRRIVAGTWPAGEQIPSVRELAADFGVNPNTVQKALAELERDGLAETRRGLGRYVTENTKMVRNLGTGLARSAAKDFIHTMKTLGFSQTEATELLQDNWKESD